MLGYSSISPNGLYCADRDGGLNGQDEPGDSDGHGIFEGPGDSGGGNGLDGRNAPDCLSGLGFRHVRHNLGGCYDWSDHA